MSYSDDDLERIMRHFDNPEQEAFSKKDIDQEFFILKDIKVKNFNGTLIESHKKIYVPKDVFEFEPQNTEKKCYMNLVEANHHLMKDGRFLPSAPLLNYIVTTLFSESIQLHADETFNIIDKEKYDFVSNIMLDSAPLLTNSIISYEKNMVEHYPGMNNLPIQSEYEMLIGFNKDNPNHVMYVPERPLHVIKPVQNLLKSNDPDSKYFDGLMGSSSRYGLYDVMEHFGIDYEINPPINEMEMAGIQYGVSLDAFSHVDDDFAFTYCIRGDQK